jgi:hypothetical protein
MLAKRAFRRQFQVSMSRFPGITSWLKVVVQKATGGRYEHVLAQENGHLRSSILPQLKVLISDAHDDARRRLRKLSTGSLDPLLEPNVKDPAAGYPERLHIQTLKGYFGEIVAGVVAEDLHPFGMKDWTVPAFLFRFHLVEFQHLSMMDQTGDVAGLRPGRTGDDCLAFRRDASGTIVATLFCEAKCTADHDADMINKAHEKSSLSNLLPVDILQIIEVLEDSADAGAPSWIDALRRLYLKGPSSAYERVDQVTYICGRKPVLKGSTSWIPSGKPHNKYTGARRLHVAEIHLSQVEDLIKKAYGVV